MLVSRKYYKAESALVLARIILSFTVEDPGCDWVVVGNKIFIRNSDKRVVAEIQRK